MGCISSKLIIARSISFHEERNQRSKRIANSIPLLEDLIKASNKLHSRSLSSNTTSKLAVEPEIPEHIVYSLTQENLPGFEDKDELRYKGDIGNRSFHTVEEYDDMVNRIWLTKSQIVQQSEFNNEDGDDDVGRGSEIKIDLQEKDSTSKNEEVVPSHETRMLESVSQGVGTIEKGNKRKAIAKRLESLSIPSNVECPAIGSLRESLATDGIYSPGSYITPKFGSYSSMNIRNENESSEDSILPELISAFEECMQKLEAEEENILKQILENVEEEIDEGMRT